MTLDVHAHLYPATYREALRRKGGPSERIAERLASSAANDRFMDGAMDERLELMAAAGIDRQVLSMPNQWVLVEDTVRCAEQAVLGNDALAEVCSRHPDYFRMFASLPLVEAEAALKELDRCRREHGALGIIMPTHVLGRPLDWEGLEPIYATMERLALPIFLHPTQPAHPVAPPGYKEYGLTSGLYFPTEDTNALMRIVYSGVLERHPNLRIICPHLGGAIPFLFKRLDRHFDREAAELPHPPSYYLRKVKYDTVSLYGPAVRCTCETFGAGQLVLGTDFPYVDGPGMKEIMGTVEELPISESDRAGILEGNAREWLSW